MWLCLNDAFLSIVQHKDDPSMLLVRARRFDDLARCFPEEIHEIVTLEEADYPYRLVMHRHTFTRFVAWAMEDIHYPNFKDSVAPEDIDRKAFYNKIWKAGYDFGKKAPLEAAPPKPPPSGVIMLSQPDMPHHIRGRSSRFAWLHKEMNRPAGLDYRDSFTWAEWKELRYGYVPEVMEEKWFVYEEEWTLHLHRSWTGFELYRVSFMPTRDGMEIVSAYYETDTERYISGGLPYERGMIRWLLRGLLLGQDVEFPIYPDTPEWAVAMGVAQHHVGGREASAYLEPALAAAVDALAREDAERRDKQRELATIEVVQGDIVAMAVDAIVNAANTALASGGGVSGAIHKAAGPELAEACHELEGCPTGEARITQGFDLPAEHVIHAVGPRWKDGTHGEPVLLASAYRSAFDLAAEYGLRSIALPAISAGSYGYPVDEVAKIAVREAREASKRSKDLARVIFVCSSENVRRAFEVALAED